MTATRDAEGNPEKERIPMEKRDTVMLETDHGAGPVEQLFFTPPSGGSSTVLAALLRLPFFDFV